MLKDLQGFINKLNLDNKKIILILLIASAVFYADYSVIVKLQSNSINSLKPKISKLKKDLDNLEREITNVKNLKTNQAQPVKSKEVISEEQLPLLIEDISNTANKNNVKILQIKPFKEKEANNASSGNFSRYNITLDLVGDYHGIGKFINDLENADKLIIVEGFKITRNGKDYLKENIVLLLKTYVKK
ncbi:MAG: type 4a pilus biogenesis protein PilO [Candidatus Omnitrophota bacterium]